MVLHQLKLFFVSREHYDDGVLMLIIWGMNASILNREILRSLTQYYDDVCTRFLKNNVWAVALRKYMHVPYSKWEKYCSLYPIWWSLHVLHVWRIVFRQSYWLFSLSEEHYTDKRFYANYNRNMQAIIWMHPLRMVKYWVITPMLLSVF